MNQVKEGREKLGNEEKWMEMFKRLQKFQEKNGHCLVPFRYAVDRKLGIWVQTQRQQYKALTSTPNDASPMTPERAEKLRQLGFEWSPKAATSVPWDARFKQLVEFKIKHGHTKVPMKCKEHVALSNWVSTQRQEYRLLQKGLKSRLTPDRLQMLEEIGFIWEAKRGSPGKRSEEKLRNPEKAVSVISSSMETGIRLNTTNRKSYSENLVGSTSFALAAAESEVDLLRRILKRKIEQDLYLRPRVCNRQPINVLGAEFGLIHEKLLLHESIIRHSIWSENKSLQSLRANASQMQCAQNRSAGAFSSSRPLMERSSSLLREPLASSNLSILEDQGRTSPMRVFHRVSPNVSAFHDIQLKRGLVLEESIISNLPMKKRKICSMQKPM